MRPKEARGHNNATKRGTRGRRGKVKAKEEREPGQQTLLGWIRKGTGSTPGSTLGARVANPGDPGGLVTRIRRQRSGPGEDQMTGPTVGQTDNGGPV